MPSPRTFSVKLYTSANTSGDDVTNYIIPQYGGLLSAEAGLLQYQAGSMSFDVLDKGTTLAERYWSTRILTSTAFTLGTGAYCTQPVIEVRDITAADDNTAPAFWGYIERSLIRWDGDAITGFTAVTQLSYFDSIDFASHCVGGGYQVCNGTAGTGSGTTWTMTTWATGAGDYVSAGILPGDTLHIGSNSYTITNVPSLKTLTTGTSVNGLSGASYVTRATLTQYSGHAAPLLRRALRVGGNASPNIDGLSPDPADVLLQDYKLGTTQAAVDWNHVKRIWQSDNAKNPVEANRLSDFVANVQYGTQLGFICVDGKLYRVDIANSEPHVATRNGIALTQITTATHSAGVAVASGYRMFPYYLADGTACLAIVQAALHEQQTRTTDNWLSSPANSGLTVARAGLDALTMGGMLAPGVGSAVAMGAQVITGALCALTSKVNCQNTGAYYWAVKSVDVMSIGDGTNDPSTGVGAAFNETVTPSIHGSLILQRGEYTLADSVCANRPTTDTASIIYFGRYNEGLASTYVTYCYWSGTAWAEGRRAGESIPGLLVGGMAARARGNNTVHLACSTGNCIYAIAINETGGRGMAYVTGRGAFSRFVGAVNAINPTTSVLFTGTVDGTVYKTGSFNNSLIISPVDISGTLPDGFKLVTTAQYPVDRGDSNIGLSCIYRARDDYGDEYHYLGWLRTIANAELQLATDLCAYPIPNGNSSDLRPPMTWKDAMSGRNTIRAIVPATTIDGALLATDFYETSLWAVPFQHHNFTTNPVTLRQYIEATARAFNCYVKLVGLTKPATTLERKVYSRFGYAPASAGGTLTAAVSVADQPKLSVTGVEYYLGFEGNAMGERIRVGSVTAGTSRYVFQFNGPFIVPAWARVMGAWVVASYPATSASYTVGRRVISASLYKLVDGLGAEVTPTYRQLYGQSTLSAFSSGNINVILLGLSFDKATNLFDATLLEYNSTDVMAAATAAEDVTLTELAAVAEANVNAPAVTGAASKQLITWDCRGLPTNSWGYNPDDGPHYYAFTVYLPHGLKLTGYRYVLLSDGQQEHNVSTFTLWHHVVDNTYGEIPEGELAHVRANVFHGGQTAGMITVGLEDIDPVQVSPGLYWLIVGIDRQDTGTPKVIAPPIAWQDGLVPQVRSLMLKADVSAGVPTVGYLDSWEGLNDKQVQSVPLVYLEGDA